MLSLTIADALLPDSQPRLALGALYSLRADMLKMVQSQSQQLSLDIVMGYMVSKKPEKDVPFVLDEHNIEQIAKRAKMLVVKEKVLGLIFSGRFNGVSEATPILLEIATLLVCLYGLCAVEDKNGTTTDIILCVAIAPYISPLLMRCLSGTQLQLQGNDAQNIQLEKCAPQQSDGLSDSDQISPLDVLSINYLTCVARVSGSVRQHTLAIVKGIRHEIERWGDYQNSSALSALLTPICSWRNEEGNLRNAAKSVGKYIKRILELCGLLASEQKFPPRKRNYTDDMNENEIDTNKENNSTQCLSYRKSTNPTYKERFSVAIRSTSLLCMMFGMDTVLNVVDTMVQRLNLLNSSKEGSPVQSSREVSNANNTDVEKGTNTAATTTTTIVGNMPKLSLSGIAEDPYTKPNELDSMTRNGEVPNYDMSPKRIRISQIQSGGFGGGVGTLETKRNIPSGLFFQALDTIAEEDEDVNTSNEINNREENRHRNRPSPLSTVLQEQQQRQAINAQQQFFACSKKFNAERIKSTNREGNAEIIEQNEKTTSKTIENKISSPRSYEESIGDDPNSILKEGLLTIVRNELRIRTILKILSKDDSPIPRDRKCTSVSGSAEEKQRKNSARVKTCGETPSCPVSNAKLDNKEFNDETNQLNSNLSKMQNNKANPLNGNILSQVTKTSVINVSNLKSGPSYNNNNNNNTNSEKPPQYPPPTITITLPTTPPNTSTKEIEEKQYDESNEAQYSYTYDEYSYEYSSNAIDKFGDVCNSSSFHETKHCIIENAPNKQELLHDDVTHDIEIPRTIMEEVGEGNSDYDPQLGESYRKFNHAQKSGSELDNRDDTRGRNEHISQGTNNANKQVRQRVKRTKRKIVLPPIERGETKKFSNE